MRNTLQVCESGLEAVVGLVWGSCSSLLKWFREWSWSGLGRGLGGSAAEPSAASILLGEWSWGGPECRLDLVASAASIQKASGVPKKPSTKNGEIDLESSHRTSDGERQTPGKRAVDSRPNNARAPGSRCD